MEWRRIKNIIILLLLLVNGFLLVLVATRRGEARQHEQAALTHAVQVLNNSGIAAREADLAGLGGLRPRSAQRSLDTEAHMAAALLGQPVEGENRGGGLYTYRTDSGQVNFRAGGELVAYLWNDPRWRTADPVDHAAGLLREMGVEGSLLREDASDGDGQAVFRQLLDGAPVHGCRVVFIYSKGALVEMSGSLLAVGETAEEEGETITLPTALMRFLDGVLASGDVCSAVLSMEPGYRMSQSFTGAVRLSPVWLVTSNTGGYYLDAVTGELSRAPEE